MAREERRVQEESEPLCQKVSRNVVNNFQLHTSEVSGVPSNALHIPICNPSKLSKRNLL
ncbi:unnamed protein product [Arabidopsis halleri]